jgi:glycosyltransferase involved in cell wall biosynthesis
MEDRQPQVPFFSIVMPIYGVEAYIEEAIKSIRIQTFANWELIVVNDCTKDRSAIIAEALASKDARIRVVHHRANQGVSGARNTGTTHAKGTYIWYMDPDDVVDADLLEQVYESLQRSPADAVLFGHIEEYYDAQVMLQYTHSVAPEEHYFTTPQAFRPYILDLEQQTMYGYVWNKCYRLDYIKEKHLRFEHVSLNEDLIFNVAFFMDAASLNTLPSTPYHYAKRMAKNLTNAFVPDYYHLHKRRIELLFEQFQYWNLCSTNVRTVLGSLYARYILSALERNCDRRAQMNYARRSRWCRMVFQQRIFQELIHFAQAQDSKSLQIAIRLLQLEKPLPCLLMGRAIHVVRKIDPMYYNQVKSQR